MKPEARLALIVDLMSDVDLIHSSLEPLFDSVIWPRAHVAAGGDPAPFRACLDAACAKMKTRLEPFVEFIIGRWRVFEGLIVKVHFQAPSFQDAFASSFLSQACFSNSLPRP